MADSRRRSTASEDARSNDNTEFSVTQLTSSSTEAFGLASWVVGAAFRAAGLGPSDMLTIADAKKVIDEHQTTPVEPAPMPEVQP